MSYALAPALQQVLFGLLSQDAALAALTAGHVYDAAPPGPVPPLYVALGEERARDRSDKTGTGAEHDFGVTVVSEAAGFQAAKQAAAAICDALEGAAPALPRGRVVALSFLRARARRDGVLRRIDLTFRARVEDD